MPVFFVSLLTLQTRRKSPAGELVKRNLSVPEDAERLKQRGILYAPDYVVNLGGAMGITSIEAEGVTEEESMENVQKTIAKTLEEIYMYAKSADINTVEAAINIARQRLENSFPT